MEDRKARKYTHKKHREQDEPLEKTKEPSENYERNLSVGAMYE